MEVEVEVEKGHHKVIRRGEEVVEEVGLHSSWVVLEGEEEDLERWFPET